MPVITKALLRKRAEHNEGMISTLEEISLHQEELEEISEVLGNICRKLKILYLQNNIIRKMQNLKYLRDLEYLNLALNNISKIEGIQNCEFLKKLDLTLNFIDFDTLELSITNLQENRQLKDLFMMGNPSQSKWDEGRFDSYVIAMLPQLETIDGKEITKSMRIQARQKLPQLQEELRELAAEVQAEKDSKKNNNISGSVADAKEDSKVSSLKNNNENTIIGSDSIVVEDASDDENDDVDPLVKDGEEMTENTPEAREEIYRELAQQKKEKEDREAANRPKERNYDKEHAAKKEEIRRKEEESGEREIRQKNEGGWSFRWDEESQRGFVILEICLPRHLDSSLIDVDVHPTYVSIVIKSKLLRLRLPAEVKSGDSRCERSKVTGSLMVIMPKLNPKENAVTIRGDIKHRQGKTVKEEEQEREKERKERMRKKNVAKVSGSATGGGRTTFKSKKGPSLQEQLLAAASASSNNSGEDNGSNSVFEGVEKLSLMGDGPGKGKAVDIRNIVPKKVKDHDQDQENTGIFGSNIDKTTSKGISELPDSQSETQTLESKTSKLISILDDGAADAMAADISAILTGSKLPSNKEKANTPPSTSTSTFVSHVVEEAEKEDEIVELDDDGNFDLT